MNPVHDFCAAFVSTPILEISKPPFGGGNEHLLLEVLPWVLLLLVREVSRRDHVAGRDERGVSVALLLRN